MSSSVTNGNGEASNFPPLSSGEEELVEKEIRDRFKRMCEGYFDSVCKKLMVEHKVCSPSEPTLLELLTPSGSGFKNRIGATTKHIYDPVKYLKIVNKHMRR